MKCPKCGEEMEEGYFTIYAGLRCAAINYWSVEKPKHRFFADPKIPQDSIEVMWTKKGKNIMQGFKCANCKIVLIHAPEMQIEPPKQIKKLSLYEQLFYLYTPIHGGRTKRVLENKIESITKQGLNREEAIHKLAEKEGLIEKE